MDLALTIVHLDKVVVASPVGELDLATAPALHEKLLRMLCAKPAPLVVIALDQLTFCDAAGLRVLVHAHRRARLLGIELRVAAPTGVVAKILRITGLDQTLAVCASVADALAVQDACITPIRAVETTEANGKEKPVSPDTGIARVG